MLLGRGAARDRSRARVLLAEAATLAKTVGMVAFGERVASLSATLPAATSPAANVFRLDGNVWTVSYEGTTVHLKDRKGLRYLARLLARPGVECHALELSATLAGRPGRAPAARELADAGALLDERAKREYRQRLDELRQELDDAEACRDPGRAERTRAEVEAIERALASAYGLGGRSSPTGSAAERARVSVTKAIRQAIDDVAAVHPRLAEHLGEAVRTGRFFEYAADRSWIG
jgi:non-specific serine/threonine protein kinase